MNNRLNSKSQITVEYLILFTAVLMVIILTVLKINSPFQNSLTFTLQERAQTMEAASAYLDQTNYVRGVKNCGNGYIEPGELCDRSDLGGRTCTILGFANGGLLRCTFSCQFDTTACVP